MSKFSISRANPRLRLWWLSVYWLLFTPCLLNAELPSPPRVIEPAGQPPVFEDDYFTDYHGEPCDFNKNGDFGRVAGFGAGITNAEVKDGALQFTLGGASNLLYFGRWFHPGADSDKPDENIGYGWPRRTLVAVVKLRMKQTGAKSRLALGMRGTHRAYGNTPGRVINPVLAPPDDLVVKGVEWREISIPFRLDRGHNTGRAFCLEWIPDSKDPAAAGNCVSIDYIRIARLRTPALFRKRFILDEEPVYGRMHLRVSHRYAIYVNDRPAASCFASLPVSGFAAPLADITPFLRKGTNTLIIEFPDTWMGPYHESRQKPAYQLVAEGLVLTKTGQFVSLNSDTGWEAVFPASANRREADFNDTDWQPAQVGRRQGYFAEDIQRYAGALQTVTNREWIFRLNDGVNIPFVLPKDYAVEYHWTDSFDTNKVETGWLDKCAQNEFLDYHVFTRKPDHPGVWELCLRLFDADREPTPIRRRMEVAVAGPITQKQVKGDSFTEGMILTPLWDINCRETNAPGAPLAFDFNAISAVTTPPSRIVNTNIGDYRESGDGAFDGFGYLFSVRHLYKPHLVEIEYPDDGERLLMAKVFCSTDRQAMAAPGKHAWNWGWEQRWYAGVRTGGGEYPPSRTFRKLHLIFWPDGDKDVNSIQIMTGTRMQRAAARRIRIYEIDDLPALDLPDTPGRLYGMFTEREHILPLTFYSGRFDARFKMYENCYDDRIGVVRNWYDTICNFIKYMRFAGQNLYAPGYYMYDGIYFPEERGQSKSSGRRPTDHFRLMAAMFEENNLYLLMGAQYMTANPPMERAFPTNWELVHAGRDTVMGVDYNGRQSLTPGSAAPGAMDYQHPLVEEDLNALVDKYLEYGKDYKSVRGVLFYSAGFGFPSLSALHYMGRGNAGELQSALMWGWNDAIVEAFEKQANVKLPGARQDPERFRKRYEYALGNQAIRDQWLDFRCRRLHDQTVRLLRRACRERPDWKLYLIHNVPLPLETQNVAAGKMTYLEALRWAGVDHRLYREDGLVNAISGQYLFEKGGKWEDSGLRRSGDAYYYTDRWPAASHTQAVVPVEPYSARDYTLPFRYLEPTVVMFGKSDVVTISGGEQYLRSFVRAFRRLPTGIYRTLTGAENAAGPIVRMCRTETGAALYAVNMDKTPVKVRIEFKRKTSLRDLSDDTRQPAGRDFVVAVPPYGLRAFEADTEAKSASQIGEMGIAGRGDLTDERKMDP